MSRLARPAARLADGSIIVARGLGRRVTAWVARGRRHDLTGWRAALGCWMRLAVLTLGVYLLWRVVRAVPNLMWLLSAGWIVAAWRAGREATAEAEEEPSEEPDTTPQMDPRMVLIHWLDRLTHDRAGIHLDELHRTLIRHPDLAHLKRAEMRAWLDRYHITVERTLRVGAVAGRSGISRTTIEALLKTVPPLPETSGSTAPLHVSDQQDSTVESAVESGVETGVDDYFDTVVRLIA